MTGIGDNVVGGAAGGRLKSIVERIERLEEEKSALAGDIREVKSEAKAAGFDMKALNALLKRRKMNEADRIQLDETLQTYERVFGL